MKKYILSIVAIFLLVAFVFISCNDNPTPRTGDEELDEKIDEAMKDAPKTEDNRSDKSRGKYPEGYSNGATDDEKEANFWNEIFYFCGYNTIFRDRDEALLDGITIVKGPTREEYEKVQEEGGSISEQYTANGVEIEVDDNKYKIYGYAKIDETFTVKDGNVEGLTVKGEAEMTVKLSDTLTCLFSVKNVNYDGLNTTSYKVYLDGEDVTDRFENLIPC